MKVRRSLTTSVVGVAAVGMLVTSCGVATQDAAAPGAGKANSAQGSTSDAPPPVATVGDGWITPYLPDWLQEIAKNNAVAALETAAEWVAKIAKNPALKWALNTVTGGIAGFLIDGLFGDSAMDQINAKLDNIQKSINDLSGQVDAGFRQLGIQADDNTINQLKVSYNTGFKQHVDLAMRATKNYAEEAKKAKPNPDALKQFDADYRHELEWFSEPTNRLSGTTQLLGSNSSGILQYTSRLAKSKYPVIDSEISKFLQNQWLYYYQYFEQAYAMFLTYSGGKKGQTKEYMQSLKNEYETQKNLLTNHYPQSVPEGTLYDTKTNIWFGLTAPSTEKYWAAQNAPTPFNHVMPDVNPLAELKKEYVGLAPQMAGQDFVYEGKANTDVQTEIRSYITPDGKYKTLGDYLEQSTAPKPSQKTLDVINRAKGSWKLSNGTQQTYRIVGSTTNNLANVCRDGWWAFNSPCDHSGAQSGWTNVIQDLREYRYFQGDSTVGTCEAKQYYWSRGSTSKVPTSWVLDGSLSYNAVPIGCADLGYMFTLNGPAKDNILQTQDNIAPITATPNSVKVKVESLSPSAPLLVAPKITVKEGPTPTPSPLDKK